MPRIKISPWLPVGLCVLYRIDPLGCFWPFLLAAGFHELGHILFLYLSGAGVFSHRSRHRDLSPVLQAGNALRSGRPPLWTAASDSGEAVSLACLLGLHPKYVQSAAHLSPGRRAVSPGGAGHEAPPAPGRTDLQNGCRNHGRLSVLSFPVCLQISGPDARSGIHLSPFPVSSEQHWQPVNSCCKIRSQPLKYRRI